MKLQEEKKLKKKGYKRIAGIDEAGRGPLAGPVVACAAIYLGTRPIKGIKDSKKISEKNREMLFDEIVKNKDVIYSIGVVNEKTIDRVNILQATKLAMKKAIKKLNADYLIIDGNFILKDVCIDQVAIKKADDKIFSCSLASIIAKVHRDRLMRKLDKKYPHYNFKKHKGYGTREHYRLLKKYGVSAVHRKSFNLGI